MLQGTRRRASSGLPAQRPVGGWSGGASLAVAGSGGLSACTTGLAGRIGGGAVLAAGPPTVPVARSPGAGTVPGVVVDVGLSGIGIGGGGTVATCG